MQEGININQGLLSLGNVISSLQKESNGIRMHVPYRDCKLTRLLKGSLGGNHKTIMIACVSPCISNFDETMSTLRYVNRAKSIKNHATVNIDPSSTVMNELQDQVATLAKELLRLRNTDKVDESGSPFSEKFLNSLICASSMASKLPKSIPLSTIPSAATISLDGLPIDDLDNSIQHSHSDIVVDASKQPLTEMLEVLEGTEDECEDAQSVLYNLMHTSAKELKIVTSADNGVIESGDNQNKDFFKSRRSSWRDSLALFDGSNESADNSTNDLDKASLNDKKECEDNQIELYDLIRTSTRELMNITSSNNGVKEKSNKSPCTPWQETYFKSRRSSWQESLELTESDDGKSMENGNEDPDKASLDKDDKILLIDYVRASLRNILDVSLDKDIGHPRVKIQNVMEDDSSNHSKFSQNYLEDAISLDTPESSTITHDVSLDESITPQENHLKVMTEYQKDYQALKVKHEIKLVKIKIENYTEEKQLLDGIINQLNVLSFEYMKIKKSIIVIQGKITKLQKRQETLLGLSNVKFNENTTATNGHNSAVLTLELGLKPCPSVLNDICFNKKVIRNKYLPPRIVMTNSLKNDSVNSSVTNESGRISFGQDCFLTPF